MDRKMTAQVIKVFGEIRDACDAGIEELEKSLAEDGDEGKDGKSEGRGSRSSRNSESSRSSSHSARDKDDDDEPSEDDIVKAARDALKVLDPGEVKKIIKKHGKAEKASEVEPKYRKAAIEALEEAADAAG